LKVNAFIENNAIPPDVLKTGGLPGAAGLLAEKTSANLQEKIRLFNI